MPFGPYKDMDTCMKANSSKKDPAAYCATVKRKLEGESLVREVRLNFNAPITILEDIKTTIGTKESATEGGQNAKRSFMVRGLAINECTSRNGVTYKADELAKSFQSLAGRPILLDHENKVANIAGKVRSSHYDAMAKGIVFTGEIMNPMAQEMIADGRLDSVSVGAIAKLLKKESHDEEEIVEATNIEFVELSLTPVPGVKAATISQAIAEAYNPQGKSYITSVDSKTTNKEDTKMAETVAVQEDMSQLKKQFEAEREAFVQEKLAFAEARKAEIVAKITVHGGYTAEELKGFSEEQLKVVLAKEQKRSEDASKAKPAVQEKAEPKGMAVTQAPEKKANVTTERLDNGRLGIFNPQERNWRAW